MLHKVENNKYDKYEQGKSCCFYPASLIFRDNKFSTNSTIIFFFFTFLFHFFLFIKFEGSKGKVFGSKIQEHIFRWRNVKTEYLLSTRGSLFTLHKYCAGSYFKLSFLLLVLCWIQGNAHESQYPYFRQTITVEYWHVKLRETIVLTTRVWI